MIFTSILNIIDSEFLPGYNAWVNILPSSVDCPKALPTASFDCPKALPIAS